MKRKVPLFIGLVLAVAVSAMTLPKRSPQTEVANSAGAPAEFKTVKSLVLGALARLAPSSPPASAPPAVTVPEEMAPRHVRVPAMREGHNYGWLQLPRGTPVDLLRVEGESLVIRYDETVVRMPQSEVRGGSVVIRDPKLRLLKI